MKNLARIAVVACCLALSACGPEAPAADSGTESTGNTVTATGGKPGPICPQVLPPQCDGNLYPIYNGSCLVGFECVPAVTASVICPKPVLPGPGFCENGTITPVYDANKCIVRYTCTL